MKPERMPLGAIRKLFGDKFGQYRYDLCINELVEIRKWITNTGEDLIKGNHIIDFDITELRSGRRPISDGVFEDMVTFSVGIDIIVEDHLPPYGLKFIIEETETGIRGTSLRRFDRAMEGV